MADCALNTLCKWGSEIMDFVTQMESVCLDTVRRGVNHTGIPLSQVGWGELLSLDRFLAERLIVVLGYLANLEGVEKVKAGIPLIKQSKKLLEPFLKYFADHGVPPSPQTALKLPSSAEVKAKYSPLFTLMLTSMSKEPLSVVCVDAPGGNKWWLPALLDNQVGVTYFDVEGQQRLLSSAVLQQQGAKKSSATKLELVEQLKGEVYSHHTPVEISGVGFYVGQQVLRKLFESKISANLERFVQIIPDSRSPSLERGMPKVVPYQ